MLLLNGGEKLLENLEIIADKIRSQLEAKNETREKALARSRELIRYCALSIRAVHRGEFEAAAELLTAAEVAAKQMVEDVATYPDLYHAGYIQDALKEYTEANVTYALITDRPLADPDDLGVEYAAYLNGLGEAAGELRRHVLDLIRHGRVEQGERILQVMEEIFSVLITIDFPDAITGKLRRTTDMVRGVLERTRGDLTTAMRQEKLLETLEAFEETISVQ